MNSSELALGRDPKDNPFGLRSYEDGVWSGLGLLSRFFDAVHLIEDNGELA